jgi:hypothetical protein
MIETWVRFSYYLGLCYFIIYHRLRANANGNLRGYINRSTVRFDLLYTDIILVTCHLLGQINLDWESGLPPSFLSRYLYNLDILAGTILRV